jgi:predicted transcriptional regulator
MVIPKHRKLEFQVLEVLWAGGPLSMRDIMDRLPLENRPPDKTVCAVIYRLQARKTIVRVRKVGHAQIFEAAVARSAVHEDLIDDFADLFAGEMQAVFLRLARTGRLTLADLHNAEQLVAAAGQPAAG